MLSRVGKNGAILLKRWLQCRFRAQFSITFMLSAVAFMGVVVSVVTREYNKRRRYEWEMRRAIESCSSIGGEVYFGGPTFFDANKSYYIVNLAGCCVEQATIDSLASSEFLKSIDFSRAICCREAMRSIACLSSVETLVLDQTSADDDTIAACARLPLLKSLSIEHTSVTDEGLDRLHGLEALEHVYLAGTRVTKQGIKRLKGANPDLEIHW